MNVGELVCMGLCVTKDGDFSLVDGCKVDEEHVVSAAPVVRLFWCAFRGDALSIVVKEWGVYGGI